MPIIFWVMVTIAVCIVLGVTFFMVKGEPDGVREMRKYPYATTEPTDDE